MRLRLNLVLSAAFLMTPALSRADIIQTTNLIVTGTLTSGAEVQGSSIIGNLTETNGNAENFAIGNGTTPSSSYNGTNSLIVGGNVQMNNTGDFKLLGGNAQIGGSVFVGSSTTNTPSAITVSSGTVTTGSSAASATVSQAAAAITSLSTYYSGLTSNSSVSLPSSQPAQVTFTATANATNGIAVFNVNASVFSSSLSQSYQLVTASGDTTYVINVIDSTHTGTASITQGNFLSGFQNNNAHIIFNFENDTTVSTTQDTYGAILASNATFTNSTAIDGSVFVKNFNQHGEVHLPNFIGNDSVPAAVPLPASVLLLGLGLPGGLIASRLSRRGGRTA